MSGVVTWVMRRRIVVADRAEQLREEPAETVAEAALEVAEV
ncbi:hypothetical protein ACWEKM_00925 [Streptomyces sp. NPDC004752]